MSFDEYAQKYYLDRIKLAKDIVRKTVEPKVSVANFNPEISLPVSLVAAVFGKLASPLYFLREEYIAQSQGKTEAVKQAVETKVNGDEVAYALRDYVKNLTITDETDGIVVGFLHVVPTDVFKKIAGIIKRLGGTYVSAGKDSHFRMPKETKT